MADTSSSKQGIILRAVRQFMRPLVRLLLHYQITFPLISQVLKELYVDVADKEFILDGKKQTDSRVSLLSGVHRKDVKKLRHETQHAEPLDQMASVGAQIVANWLSDPRFLDQNGAPNPLPQQGDGASFETIVTETMRQDIRPKVVLDEWLNLGLVSLNDESQVQLNVSAFIPEHNFEDKAYFFGKNMSDHLSAAVHNLSDGRPPQFDRAVFYNHLTPESIDHLKKLVDEKAMELLQLVNKEAKQLQIQDKGKADADIRFNLGAYFWLEQREKGSEDPTKERAND